MSRPRALLLTHRIPYPPDKGDKIRSWRLLRHLAKRYELSVGCFVDDEDDWQHADTVRAACAEACFRPLRPGAAAFRSVGALARGEAITLARYRDRMLAAWVRERQVGGLAVQVGFSAAVLPYLLGTDAARGAPVIADLCDADSAKWSAYAAEAGGPKRLIYAREGRRLAAYEAMVTRDAARTFLVTPEEADLVRALPGADGSRVDHYRNGVDTDHFRPGAVPPAPGGCDVVLTGAMDYRPNVAAATGFVRDAWPIVRAARPDVTFAIVGARPTPMVRALAGAEGVTVTGRVPDTRPWLEAARVAVAPLAVARGVQNKVLEALAMGTPLVCSEAAARGTQATSGEHLLTAQGPEATARAVLDLLDDPGRAARMGRAARAFAEGTLGSAHPRGAVPDGRGAARLGSVPISVAAFAGWWFGWWRRYAVARFDLTDEEWAIIRPLLPNKPRGMPRVDDRRVLDGIFYVLRTGAPWRDLPERYGPYTTVYNRFNRWAKAGVWVGVFEALAARSPGSMALIDASVIRTHQHAAGGKKGVRITPSVALAGD